MGKKETSGTWLKGLQLIWSCEKSTQVKEVLLEKKVSGAFNRDCKVEDKLGHKYHDKAQRLSNT